MDDYDLERKFDDINRRVDKIEAKINLLFRILVLKENVDKKRFSQILKSGK